MRCAQKQAAKAKMNSEHEKAALRQGSQSRANVCYFLPQACGRICQRLLAFALALLLECGRDAMKIVNSKEAAGSV